MNKYLFRVYQFSKEIQEGSSIYKLENAQKYIEDSVRKLDWTSYSISKHIPKQIRQDYINICAFHNELLRIEESTKEKSLGVGKMQYWHDQLDQIYKDNPPKEPLAICLHNSCKNNPLPKYLFQKMINNRQKSIENPEFLTLAEMAMAAESNRGPQMMLTLRLLRQDIENQHIRQAVELASQSVGIADYLKRVPYTLQNYKLKLPEDIKLKYRVNVRSLWDRIKGEPKEELYDVVLEVAAFSRKLMIQTAAIQDQLPPQAFRAFLHLSEVEHYLEMLEYYNFNIFEKSINQNSYVQLPLRIFQNCRKSHYLRESYTN